MNSLSIARSPPEMSSSEASFSANALTCGAPGSVELSRSSALSWVLSFLLRLISASGYTGLIGGGCRYFGAVASFSIYTILSFYYCSASLISALYLKGYSKNYSGKNSLALAESYPHVRIFLAILSMTGRTVFLIRGSSEEYTYSMKIRFCRLTYC